MYKTHSHSTGFMAKQKYERVFAMRAHLWIFSVGYKIALGKRERNMKCECIVFDKVLLVPHPFILQKYITGKNHHDMT